EVRVPVDEAGRHEVALGVDLPHAAFADTADLRDDVAGDGDVGPEASHAGAVDDRSVPDDQIERHASDVTDSTRMEPGKSSLPRSWWVPFAPWRPGKQRGTRRGGARSGPS